MLDQIKKTEIKYLECFCETEKDGASIKFTDAHIKDMYSHHFTYIDEGIDDRSFVKEMRRAYEEKKRRGEKVLRIMTHKEISEAMISQMPLKPEIETFNYYGQRSENYKSIKQRKDTTVKLANCDLTITHGKYVDVAANYKHMTMEFAIRRIERKFKVYLDENKPLFLHVCYENEEPIGNCESFVDEGIMKIEDFDILDVHQRKGFGSHVLYHLLEKAYNDNIPFAYVVTDHDDTAKNMYEKCGFEYIGHRTELTFKLEDSNTK